MSKKFALAQNYRHELIQLFKKQNFSFSEKGTNIHNTDLSDGYELLIVVRKVNPNLKIPFPGDLRVELKFSKTNMKYGEAKEHAECLLLCNEYTYKKYEFRTNRKNENLIYMPLMDIIDLNNATVDVCWTEVRKSIHAFIADFNCIIPELNILRRLQ